MEDLLLRVERTYWELAFAQAEARIKARSEKQALAQFKTTEENIRRGLLAAGEIHVVNENLVIFQQQGLLARENLAVAQRNLAQLLNLPLDKNIFAIDSLDTAAPAMPRDISIDKSPALGILKAEVEREARRLKFEDNQTDPRLDLDARVGLVGQPNSPWEEVSSGSRPEGRVGVTFEIPLDWSPYRAQVRAAQLTQKQKPWSSKQPGNASIPG